jgi:hypothetical protein
MDKDPQELLTREEIAQELKISLPTLDRYRKGKGIPDGLGVFPEPDSKLLLWTRERVHRWARGERLMTGLRVKVSPQPGQSIDKITAKLKASKLFTVSVYEAGDRAFVIEAMWPSDSGMSADHMLDLLNFSRHDAA